VFGTDNVWMFVLAGVTLNLTPGPDTLYIVGRSIAQGRDAGIASALGIATGLLVHTTAAALGLSALLVSSSAAFAAVKWVGAAYLVWLGVQMIRSGTMPELAPERDLAGADRWTIYRQGLVTNVFNPKVALFFLAFLPQFVDPARADRPWPFLFLGSLFICTGTAWSFVLVFAAARASRAVRRRPRSLALARRVTGAVFVALGLRLATQQAR